MIIKGYMGNAIKFSKTDENLALRKGNFYLGTGDVGKGPSDKTGYYNGISPTPNGYTIYVSNEDLLFSYQQIDNDDDLILFASQTAGVTFNNLSDSLIYISNQDNIALLNYDYPAMRTKSLITHLDAGFTLSYPMVGETWHDIGIFNFSNGKLHNSCSFSKQNGGKIVLDGIDEYIKISNKHLSNFYINDSTFNLVFDDSNSSFNANEYLYSNGVFSCQWKPVNSTCHVTINNVIKYNLDFGTTQKGLKFLTVVISDNYNCKFFLNGELKIEEDFSGSMTNHKWGPDFELGRLFNGSFGPYSKFDYHLMSIYNKALTDEEVIDNYNSMISKYENCDDLESETQNMYDDRKYLIIPYSQIDLIDFNQTLNTMGSLRFSRDKSKTIIKWKGETPTFVSNLVDISSPLSYSEIKNVITKPEWTVSVVIES